VVPLSKRDPVPAPTSQHTLKSRNFFPNQRGGAFRETIPTPRNLMPGPGGHVFPPTGHRPLRRKEKRFWKRSDHRLRVKRPPLSAAPGCQKLPLTALSRIPGPCGSAKALRQATGTTGEASRPLPDQKPPPAQFFFFARGRRGRFSLSPPVPLPRPLPPLPAFLPLPPTPFNPVTHRPAPNQLPPQNQRPPCVPPMVCRHPSENRSK